MEKCCEMFDEYEKLKKKQHDWVIIDNKRVWPADEEMKFQLALYDEAHSRSRCICEEYLRYLEKELTEYGKKTKSRACFQDEENVVLCLQTDGSLYKCNREIDNFKNCVNDYVAKVFDTKRKKF